MLVPLNEYDFLRRALKVFPEKEAVVSGDVRLTYAQLGSRVNAWAHTMRELGVEKGDRVAILSQNDHRMLEAFFGAPLIGAILMSLNFRLLPSDFEYILNHGEAKVVIVESGLEHLVESIRPQLTTVNHFVASERPSKGWLDHESMLAAAPLAEAQPADIEENEASALLYTSGTTGRPKGVMLTHRNIYINALNATIEFGLDASDVYLHTLAMFHCNGWGLPYSVTGAGAKHVIVKK